jgi:hypothetical protein
MISTRISTMSMTGHILTGLRGTKIAGSISYTFVTLRHQIDVAHIVQCFFPKCPSHTKTILDLCCKLNFQIRIFSISLSGLTFVGHFPTVRHRSDSRRRAPSVVALSCRTARWRASTGTGEQGLAAHVPTPASSRCSHPQHRSRHP